MAVLHEGLSFKTDSMIRMISAGGARPIAFFHRPVDIVTDDEDIGMVLLGLDAVTELGQRRVEILSCRPSRNTNPGGHGIVRRRP